MRTKSRFSRRRLAKRLARLNPMRRDEMTATQLLIWIGGIFGGLVAVLVLLSLGDVIRYLKIRNM